MPDTGADSERRRQAILDAAARLFAHHGYDKTTIGDIAAEVGLSRGLIYLLYKNKDDIFEALLARATAAYGQRWLETIEADPRGGTIGAMYRAVLSALNASPFMAAMIRRDKHIFGAYLRKPRNLFASMESPTGMTDLLYAMQQAGAVRSDIGVPAVAQIMEMLSLGLVSTPIASTQPTASFDELMETIGEMLNRLLTPEGGGDLEAGKAILRQIGEAAQARYQQMSEPQDDVTHP